jgi:hypothetical protein
MKQYSLVTTPAFFCVLRISLNVPPVHEFVVRLLGLKTISFGSRFVSRMGLKCGPGWKYFVAVRRKVTLSGPTVLWVNDANERKDRTCYSS